MLEPVCLPVNVTSIMASIRQGVGASSFRGGGLLLNQLQGG